MCITYMEEINIQPTCTVALVYYKRPLFLAECVRSMYRKPGLPFELLIWSNDCDNKGSYALEDIFKKVKTKYFVVVEEDEIWFQDDWLKLLVEAFEQSPRVPEEAQQVGWKNEWGILASNTLRDDVNSNTIPYKGMIRVKMGKFIYWYGIRAGGGVMIFKTETLKELYPFGKDKHLNGGLYPLTLGYEKAKYPQARVENIYIYHAFSPYWNALYPRVFEEKQEGQTIEEAKQYYSCDYKNKKPMKMLVDNKFDKYAKGIYNKNIKQGFGTLAKKSGLKWRKL